MHGRRLRGIVSFGYFGCSRGMWGSRGGRAGQGEGTCRRTGACSRGPSRVRSCAAAGGSRSSTSGSRSHLEQEKVGISDAGSGLIVKRPSKVTIYLTGF